MSDTIEAPQQANAAIPPELAQQMAISLGQPLPPEQQPTETQPSQTVVETPTEAAPVVAADPFSIFKEKFNYASQEDAIRDIEELRAFKANPTVADFKYENEYSEKVHKAILGGKMEDVYKMLEQQQRLNSITSLEINDDNAAEIIKTGMRIKHPDLTQSEIDFTFKKQYQVPKQPVQGTAEEDEEFQARMSEWKEQVADINTSKVIAAKLLRPDLEAAKATLVLPEIEQAVDEDYLQWKKDMEEQPKLNAQIQEAYKTFTPKTLETKLNFNDEINKVAFDFQYEPKEESFKRTMEMTSDIQKFFDIFKKPDGNPDRERFARALHFAVNAEEIMMEAMKQTKNATIKATLPDNSQGGLVRQLPQTQGELTELQKQMEASLSIGKR